MYLVADPRWLEVSFMLSGELAEALSEVLGRFVEGGVAVESGVRFDDAEDEGKAFGPVRIYGYIPVDAQLEEKRQKLEEAVWYLSRIQELPKPTYTPIEDQDWMNSWKQHYKPIEIGDRIMIVPAWMNPDTLGRIPLRIDPSMAFGTGTHPTTQLCLMLLEKYVQPGITSLDVGCGSGILSIAALKLGADKAIGVDIDPLSVKASYENAALNLVTEAIRVYQGSVSELLDGIAGIKESPLVLANILAPVIIRLFDAGMGQLVSDGGTIILSGILDHQAADVIRSGEKHGLQLIDKAQIDDWVALAMEKA
jgi:ribosomal protein L11 methyltransferase